ncbi:MAG: deoxyribodipyrimidine photo-lyase [Gammaproteobacteria bacterium]
MSTALVWFRQDLRLADNPALHHACQHYQFIIPVYILDDTQQPSLGGAQRWWLHHSLEVLQQTLHKIGGNLILRRGSTQAILETLIKQQQVDAVFWNRCYEPAAIERDKTIKQILKTQQITVQSFNSALLHEPWDITNKQGDYFKVFTPYWKACCQQLQVRELLPQPKKLNLPKDITSEPLSQWSLLPTHPDWSGGLVETWQPGEKAAHKRLKSFLTEGLHDYHVARDRPDQLGTSRLSPHLHFGEISPWQIWHAVQTEAATSPSIPHKAVERYLAELGWREFSYHLLFHFNTLDHENFRAEFDAFPWENDPQKLTAWQRGQTGYPIIDAGMRELWHTGYMHNRVRMIVASFLTKDLLIDWRHGAEWFWDTLVDADMANNSASWQWTAGCGADAAPYFRIFNPVLQGEKFDPQGEYVKQWVPELADLAAKYIHKPWEISHGKGYPDRLIDHHVARERALKFYKHLKDT